MNKKSLVLILLGYLSIIAPVLANTATNSTTILILGDSISAAYGIDQEDGWVHLLENQLKQLAPNINVVNASISGETTQGGLTRLPQALQTHQPNIVVIELGGNDGLRGYPLKRIRQNLMQLVSLSKQSGAQVILAGMKIPPNYGMRYVNAFHNLFQQVANEENTYLVPFLLEGITPEDVQNDGIHPKASVQSLLLDNVWLVLEPLITQKPANTAQ